MAFAALLAMQFTSCEKYVLPELSFAPDTLSFKSAADSSKMKLNCNVIWYVDPGDAEWITFNPAYGEGPADIMVSVTENGGEALRSATVYFVTETLKKSFIVEQESLPQ